MARHAATPAPRTTQFARRFKRLQRSRRCHGPGTIAAPYRPEGRRGPQRRAAAGKRLTCFGDTSELRGNRTEARQKSRNRGTTTHAAWRQNTRRVASGGVRFVACPVDDTNLCRLVATSAGSSDTQETKVVAPSRVWRPRSHWPKARCCRTVTRTAREKWL